MAAVRSMVLAIPLMLASCATAGENSRPASLIRSDGMAIGTVSVRETSAGLALTVTAAGLPPGQLGMHIHQVGRCDGPGFESAGPHWNPTGRQHGRLNPAGRHAGDLGNLQVLADGSVSVEVAGPNASVFDADGAALVIHAQKDDERTDPSGNSGARIACAVLAGP